MTALKWSHLRNEMFQQNGDTADIEAAMRADECPAAGDIEEEVVWLRILKAVEELLATHPQEEEVINSALPP